MKWKKYNIKEKLCVIIHWDNVIFLFSCMYVKRIIVSFEHIILQLYWFIYSTTVILVDNRIFMEHVLLIGKHYISTHIFWQVFHKICITLEIRITTHYYDFFNITKIWFLSRNTVNMYINLYYHKMQQV